MGRSVAATARHADGWLPVFFDPEKFPTVWGDDLGLGPGRAGSRSCPLQIWRRGDGGDRARSTPATVPTVVLDLARPQDRGLRRRHGARDKNFYNSIAKDYGYVDEAAETRISTWSGLQGRSRRRRPPRLNGPGRNLVGPESAGSPSASPPTARPASPTSRLNPVGPDPVKTVETLRRLID